MKKTRWPLLSFLLLSLFLEINGQGNPFFRNPRFFNRINPNFLTNTNLVRRGNGGSTPTTNFQRTATFPGTQATGQQTNQATRTQPTRRVATVTVPVIELAGSQQQQPQQPGTQQTTAVRQATGGQGTNQQFPFGNFPGPQAFPSPFGPSFGGPPATGFAFGARPMGGGFGPTLLGMQPNINGFGLGPGITPQINFPQSLPPQAVMEMQAAAGGGLGPQFGAFHPLFDIMEVLQTQPVGGNPAQRGPPAQQVSGNFPTGPALGQGPVSGFPPTGFNGFPSLPFNFPFGTPMLPMNAGNAQGFNMGQQQPGVTTQQQNTPQGVPQGVPQMPQFPQNQQTSQFPQNQQTPQFPQNQQTSQFPQNQQTPQPQQIPQNPQIPQNAQMPQNPQMPQIQGQQPQPQQNPQFQINNFPGAGFRPQFPRLGRPSPFSGQNIGFSRPNMRRIPPFRGMNMVMPGMQSIPQNRIPQIQPNSQQGNGAQPGVTQQQQPQGAQNQNNQITPQVRPGQNPFAPPSQRGPFPGFPGPLPGMMPPGAGPFPGMPPFGASPPNFPGQGMPPAAPQSVGSTNTASVPHRRARFGEEVTSEASQTTSTNAITEVQPPSIPLPPQGFPSGDAQQPPAVVPPGFQSNPIVPPGVFGGPVPAFPVPAEAPGNEGAPSDASNSVASVPGFFRELGRPSNPFSGFGTGSAADSTPVEVPTLSNSNTAPASPDASAIVPGQSPPGFPQMTFTGDFGTAPLDIPPESNEPNTPPVSPADGPSPSGNNAPQELGASPPGFGSSPPGMSSSFPFGVDTIPSPAPPPPPVVPFGEVPTSVQLGIDQPLLRPNPGSTGVFSDTGSIGVIPDTGSATTTSVTGSSSQPLVSPSSGDAAGSTTPATSVNTEASAVATTSSGGVSFPPLTVGAKSENPLEMFLGFPNIPTSDISPGLVAPVQAETRDNFPTVVSVAELSESTSTVAKHTAESNKVQTENPSTINTESTIPTETESAFQTENLNMVKNENSRAAAQSGSQNVLLTGSKDTTISAGAGIPDGFPPIPDKAITETKAVDILPFLRQ